ncbi:MAG TPA: hypothetical protein VGS28_02900 [Candidatus Saccharimonadales bacterium]|nr:hypothetical protein [Candidatus Saccharimonadales bacterium]
MARLPVVGGDSGNWGSILNDYLSVSLNGDGTIQSAAVVQAGAVTSVNSKLPTNGSVTLAASDVGALTQSTADSRYLQVGGDIGGTTSSPTVAKLNGVSISGTPSSGQTLTATSGTSASWQTGAYVQYATGLVADHGKTDNQPTLQAALNALNTAGGGTLRIPAATSSYGLKSDLTVPAGVTLFLEGVGPWKNPGSSVPAVGSLTCATLSPAQGATFTNGMIVLGGKGATIRGGMFLGYGPTNSGTAPNAFRTIYRNALGTRIRETFIWGASVICIDDPGQQVAQDSGIEGIVISNNLITPSVIQQTVSSVAGNVVTVSSSTGISVGAPVLDFTTPGNIAGGTTVTGVNGNQITLSITPVASPSGNTLAFFVGIGGRIAADDNWMANSHPQYATWISNSADIQYANCHFSEAANAAVAVANLYHGTGQGATYSNCTFDNASNSSSPAHIVRVQGPLTINGGRFQQKGATGGGFPVVQELNLDSAPTTIVGTSVPNLSGTAPFSALIAYSTGSKSADVVIGVTTQGNEITSLYTGGNPGVSKGNILNGTVQTDIPAAGLPAITFGTVSDPTPITATSQVMAGLGITYTPVNSTSLSIEIDGAIGPNTANTTVQVSGRYGTGSVPSNNGTLTGTAFPQGTYTLQPASFGQHAYFRQKAKITGLSIGTTYWFDLGVDTFNASDAVGLHAVAYSVMECQ